MTNNRNNWQEADISALRAIDGVDAQQLRVLSSYDEEQLNMMVHHHPDETLLLDYATGAMGEAESLVIATHMALCPLCRRKVSALEAVGGATLEMIDAVPLEAKAFDRIMAKITDHDHKTAVVEHYADSASPKNDSQVAASLAQQVPRPLRDSLPAGLSDLPWQNVLRGLDEVSLQVGSNEMVRTKMLRIQPGAAMPQHTHEGAELTLVLSGAFSDERGHFARGDLAFTDSDVEHRPVADEGEVCYCLAVTTAPLRLTGPIGRFMNPFIKY